MAAPPLSNNFEGGVAGNTILTTDGGSGNNWQQAVQGTGCTLQYSSAQVHSGTLSARIVMPASGASATLLSWDTWGSITTDVWYRGYFYFLATPNANMELIEFRTAANAFCGGVAVTTSGFCRGLNAGEGAINTGSVAIALNQWIRIEARIVASTTVGQLDWWLYNNTESLAASDSLTSTSQVLGANTDRVDLGMGTSPFITSQTFYMDDQAIRTDGKIGPSLLPTSTEPIAVPRSFPSPTFGPF